MAELVSPEERATWMAAAEKAGIMADDTRQDIITKAADLGYDVRWIVTHGHDILGVEHERMMAYVQGKNPWYQSDLLAASSVEEAMRLVIGEALIARGEFVHQ